MRLFVPLYIIVLFAIIVCDGSNTLEVNAETQSSSSSSLSWQSSRRNSTSYRKRYESKWTNSNQNNSSSSTRRKKNETKIIQHRRHYHNVSIGTSLLHVLHEKEIQIIHQLQQKKYPKWCHSVSLMIHDSLSPKILSPLFSLIGWTVSLPLGASLTCFLCFQDILNISVKWIIRRPRPLHWNPPTHYCTKEKHRLRQGRKGSNDVVMVMDKLGFKEDSYESFSFPSAHAQFFSGLAFCGLFLFHPNVKRVRYMGGEDEFLSQLCFGLELTLAFVCSIVVGITRSYLGVHWPTDSLCGIILGSILGSIWGIQDPYHRIIRIMNGTAMYGNKCKQLGSLGISTAITMSIIFVCWGIQCFYYDQIGRDGYNNLTKKADCDFWTNDRLHSLSSSKKQNDSAKTVIDIPVENILSKKIAPICTIWSLLALTSILPEFQHRSLNVRILEATIGLLGLGGLGFAKKKMDDVIKGFDNNPAMVVDTVHDNENSQSEMNSTNSLPKKILIRKGCLYIILCVWTFFITPHLSHYIMSSN